MRVLARTGWKSLAVSSCRADEKDIGDMMAVRISREIIVSYDFHFKLSLLTAARDLLVGSCSNREVLVL